MPAVFTEMTTETSFTRKAMFVRTSTARAQDDILICPGFKTFFFFLVKAAIWSAIDTTWGAGLISTFSCRVDAPIKEKIKEIHLCHVFR